MKVIRRVDDARLIELARGIATGDMLVVDAERREWLTSLAILAPGLAEYRNLGLVLVPLAPHLGGRWINGTVPAVTVECVPVAKGDVAPLQRHLNAMIAALHPASDDDL